MSETTAKGLSVPKNPAMALRELNKKHAAATSRTAESRAEMERNNTILQTDKQTNTPTNKPTNKPTNQQTSQQTNQPTDKPTIRQTDRPSNKPTGAGPAARIPSDGIVVAGAAQGDSPQRSPRVDGRTLRVRQITADATMVTSFRLAVSTVEALDDFCWRHRMRKQDVVQAALDLYFRASDEIED